jgi:hypothetical protein
MVKDIGLVGVVSPGAPMWAGADWLVVRPIVAVCAAGHVACAAR